MTEQQKTALEHHCRFAFETAQGRFGRPIMSRPGGMVIGSVLLTVNSGWE